MVTGGSPLHGDGIDATEREDEMKRGQSNEYAAKTVEDAVDEGLRQLGVSREEVNIEVLDEGSRGILGIGASDALVRLTRNPRDRETSTSGKRCLGDRGYCRGGCGDGRACRNCFAGCR